jgi:hypothetical protein
MKITGDLPLSRDAIQAILDSPAHPRQEMTEKLQEECEVSGVRATRANDADIACAMTPWKPRAQLTLALSAFSLCFLSLSHSTILNVNNARNARIL